MITLLVPKMPNSRRRFFAGTKVTVTNINLNDFEKEGKVFSCIPLEIAGEENALYAVYFGKGLMGRFLQGDLKEIIENK